MRKLREHGFTILELMVVIVVSSILVGVVTSFALTFWTNTAVVESDENTLVSRLNAGDYLRDALNSAVGLINQNDLADPHTGNTDPADNSGNYWLPIHAVPGTISAGAPGTITPVVYFNRPSTDTSKNIIMNGTIPYQDDVIIYLNGTTKQLLARVIANPDAPDNRAKTTCPAAQATNACPADTVIAENVSAVDTRYFSRSGNTIDYTSITDPNTGEYIGPDFPSVEVIEFNLKLFKKAQLHSGADTSNQTVIRIALRN
jgi:prepilin-type N-terminal cleavage/methylation domain-containing protein